MIISNLTKLHTFFFLLYRCHKWEQPSCHRWFESKEAGHWPKALLLLWNMCHLWPECWEGLPGWWVLLLTSLPILNCMSCSLNKFCNICSLITQHLKQLVVVCLFHLQCVNLELSFVRPAEVRFYCITWDLHASCFDSVYYVYMCLVLFILIKDVMQGEGKVVPILN
jgi:hypothetical protein